MLFIINWLLLIIFVLCFVHFSFFDLYRISTRLWTSFNNFSNTVIGFYDLVGRMYRIKTNQLVLLFSVSSSRRVWWHSELYWKSKIIVLPGASQPLDEPSLYKELITENYKYPRTEFTLSCDQSLFILGRQLLFL